MVREKSWQAAKLLLSLALLAPPVAWSKQSSDGGATQDPGTGNPPTQTQTTGTDSGSNQSEPNPAATTPGLFARALNSASPLPGDNGPLQWGWFSVRSLSYSQYFNNATSDNPGTPAVSQDFNASELSAAIVVNRAFTSSRLTRLTIQYEPNLLITEAPVYSNSLSQSAGLDMAFQFNPRWTMQVSDRFSYFGDQRYFAGLSLGVNYTQGTATQLSFLNGPGSVIYNTAGATFTYLWSQRTTVSFTPSFGYQNSSGAMQSAQNLSGLYAGGQALVSYAFSPTQSIGMSYVGQYASYTNTSTTAGPQGSSVQQDALGTYDRQIAASWHLGLGFGLANNTGTSSGTSFAARAGITKSFHRMDIALNYYRGHQFNGYITSESSGRVDLVNTIRWSRRFTTSTSGAYFRTVSGPTSGPSGIYATEQLSFALTRALSLTSDVAYTKQVGDGVYIASGHSRLATVGVAWAPAATTQH